VTAPGAARTAALLVTLAACGGGPSPADQAPRRPSVDRTGAKGASPEATAPRPVPDHAEIASRGARDAPMMREVRRLEWPNASGARITAEHDACFRAAFEAASTIDIAFVDERGEPRSEAARGEHGLVPPRGPVCVKKGEAIELAPSTPSRAASRVLVRAVIWAAP
jgi:hypothetical protein